MQFVHDDGGRAAAGYKGSAGDCVCRAVAIASGRSYPEVYDALADGTGNERKTRERSARSARNGIHTSKDWFKRYMREIGFVWTPCMGIGTGCRVHLHDGELPMGRLVVSVSKHLTAVIDGVIHDTYDPQREAHVMHFNGASSSDDPRVVHSIARRCVYGYWEFKPCQR
jgi:hypothetical protein